LYELLVFYDDDLAPRARVPMDRAMNVLAAIPTLVERYPGYQRILVMSGAARLFWVDREGELISD
jgi:hypothetical protein